MSTRKKKLKDADPMPEDVHAQADILDMQTPPPAPDPEMKDPDTADIVPPVVDLPVEQMQLFDDNHQIVDELEKFQQEITDQISRAYDAIIKKKIEIGILEGRKANIKAAIDMALALLGKEAPAAPKDEPVADDQAKGGIPQPPDAEKKPKKSPSKRKKAQRRRKA